MGPRAWHRSAGAQSASNARPPAAAAAHRGKAAGRVTVRNAPGAQHIYKSARPRALPGPAWRHGQRHHCLRLAYAMLTGCAAPDACACSRRQADRQCAEQRQQRPGARRLRHRRSGAWSSPPCRRRLRDRDLFHGRSGRFHHGRDHAIVRDVERQRVARAQRSSPASSCRRRKRVRPSVGFSVDGVATLHGHGDFGALLGHLLHRRPRTSRRSCRPSA